MPPRLNTDGNWPSALSLTAQASNYLRASPITIPYAAATPSSTTTRRACAASMMRYARRRPGGRASASRRARRRPRADDHRFARRIRAERTRPPSFHRHSRSSYSVRHGDAIRTLGLHQADAIRTPRIAPSRCVHASSGLREYPREYTWDQTGVLNGGLIHNRDLNTQNLIALQGY